MASNRPAPTASEVEHWETRENETGRERDHHHVYDVKLRGRSEFRSLVLGSRIPPWASARVCGVQPKCKPTFFWGGWQKIVAQIRGVFRKMITNTPPGGQNLAQNGVFTPRFRLHTGVTRLLDVFFDRASVFFEVGAIPVLLILGTIPFRPRVLTLHVTA